MSNSISLFQRLLLSRRVHQRLSSSKQLHTLYQQQKSLSKPALLNQPIEQSRYIVMDTETTGFHAYSGDQIISIAMIEYQGLEPSGNVFETFINPQRSIPPESTEIHHITDDDVSHAPTIEAALPGILAFIGDAIIVGHHTLFDIRFLNKTLKPYLGITLQNPWLDTMLLFLAYKRKLGHYQLEDAANDCGIVIHNRHTALGDAQTAGELFSYLTTRLCNISDPVFQLKNQQVKYGEL